MHAAEVDDFVVDDLNHVEGFVICHGVDKNETVDANCMFRIKDGILILRESEKVRA